MRRRRRVVISLAAGLVLGPFLAAAQPAGGSHAVGILTPHFDSPAWPAFFDRLRELGYDEGRNLRLLKRSAEGRLDRLPALAADLVESRVEVILALNTPGTRAAIRATADIPIVMAEVGDPIATGFVKSLARPGGNVTGVSNASGELAGKRLSVLAEAVPAARRVAALYHPDDPINPPQIREVERVAPSAGVEVRFFALRSPAELPAAFEQMAAWSAQAALWLSGQSASFQKPTIELAARHRLPTMVIHRQHVASGGLISYFHDSVASFRRVAEYVDRILKGAKPADLPVEEPTKFELAVNLKTAEALGLTIPQSILLRADEVIE